MTITKLAIITLFFAAPIALCAQETGSGSAKSKDKPWDQLTPYEQGMKSSRIKGVRKIKIAPTAHKNGIQSGCVIAYGHFIHPPYELSYLNRKLMINGVQVNPSLVLEQEQKAVKPIDEKRLTAAKKQISVTQEIREKYRQEKTLKSEAQMRTDLIAFAKTKDIVLDARWEDKAFLVSFRYGTGFELLSLDAPEKPLGWKQKTSSELRTAAEDRKLGQLRKVLESGGCVVFNSSNGQKIIQDPRQAVTRILKNQATSKEEKAEALANEVFLGSYEESFDVVENYDPKEWAKE